MDWKQQILNGMKLLQAGCKENTDWPKCSLCPFTKYCDYLMEASGGLTPEDLFDESEK